MKITNYIQKIFIVGAMGLATISCEDFLNVEPLNEIVLENFWTEEADVQNVVNSCYEALQTSNCITRMSSWGEMRSDNIIGGVNMSEDINQMMRGNLLPSSSFTNWSSFYNVINRCNTVLYYAPEVQQKDPNYTTSELNANIAEAKTLRALAYFYLIRAFRDVPYVTEPSIDDNQVYVVPAAEFDSILTASIADLEEIKDNAVRRYAVESDNTVRITRYAVYALLADMYLWKQDYDNCIKYCDLIISYKQEKYEEQRTQMTGGSTIKLYNTVYPLISEQATATNSGNAFNEIFVDGNSFESIFEIAHVRGQGARNSFVDTYYGNSTDGGQLSAPESLFKDAYTSTGNDVFKRTDCRYLETMEESSSGLFAIMKYTTNTAISFNNTSSTSTAPEVSPAMKKFTSGDNTSNWIVYRLTDIMLLKAEAEVQKAGELSAGATATEEQTQHLRSAFTLVSAVYNRANNLSITSSDTLVYSTYASSRSSMEELVLAERRRELLFEGKRWFDLVRMARRDGDNRRMIGYAVTKYTDNQSAMRKKLNSPDALYFPYNREELRINTLLTQNPAYETEEQFQTN